jgi:hypothetical protein
LKKNSKSPTKKEPKEQTSKRTRLQRPVQRKTKEVLAELVEKLRGKLELKATPARLGEAGQRSELRPNLDRLTLGVDLGDQWSNYCILGLEGERLSEGQVGTTQADVAEFFGAIMPARVVIEVGTHSAWVQEIIAGCGHEVLVANPRLMEGSKRRKRKNDRIDANKLARLASGSPVVAPDQAPQSGGTPGPGAAASPGCVGGGTDGADQHDARFGQEHGHTITQMFESELRAQGRGSDTGTGTGSIAAIGAISRGAECLHCRL